MMHQEMEDLFIASLDRELTMAEATKLAAALKDDATFAKDMSLHVTAREILRIQAQPSFGPSFTNRLLHRIQNTGVVIDRQIFSLFRRFQLVAAGIVIGLLVLNIVFSEQRDWKSALGLETETAAPEEPAAPFDFSETLTNL